MAKTGLPDNLQPEDSANNKITERFQGIYHNVERLNALISTSAGQDAVLASIEYLSHALHHILPEIKPRRPKTHQQARVSPLLALSSSISDARYVLRLFGLVRLFKLARHSHQRPGSDFPTRSLVFFQMGLLAMYQSLENISYLTTKGVLSRSLIERYGRIEKWYLWSARCLAGYSMFRLIHLLRERLPAQRERLSSREWWKAFTTHILWTPLCIHWSVEGGIGIPNGVSGIIGFWAGAWGLSDSWSTAII